MSLNLRSSGNPLTQPQLDNNLTFLYSRDITGSTVTGTTLFLYKQDGTVLTTQLPSNSGGTGVDTFTTGFTFTNNNTLTISRNQGLSNLPVTINNLTLTGLTVNGSISASTYLGLPQTVPGSPVNSIQFNGGSNVFSGSSNFTFNPSTNVLSLVGTVSITGNSTALSNMINGGVTNFITNNNSGTGAYSANGLIMGRGGSSISTSKFLFTTGYTNTYIRNTDLTTVETVGAVSGGLNNSSLPTKQINFIASQNGGSVFEWHYNTSNTLADVTTAKMILSASTGNLFTSGSYSTTALTLRNTPTLHTGTTSQVLVRDTMTGNVEVKNIGNVYYCALFINSTSQPNAGVIPSVPVSNGGIADKGRFITGFTQIASNGTVSTASGVGNYVTSPPSCSFGSFNNNTGVFTITQAGLYLVEGAIHLKPDTSSSVYWQSGTTSGTSSGTFGLGICDNTITNIYGGNYMTVQPNLHTEIDISTSNLIYADGTNDYVSLKYLNWTNRNYDGTVYPNSDGIRFSITKVY